MEHRVCIVIKGQVVCSLWFECSSSALINPFHRSEFHLLGGNKVSNFFHSRQSEGSTSMLPSFYMQDGGADYDVYDQKVLQYILDMSSPFSGSLLMVVTQDW